MAFRIFRRESPIDRQVRADAHAADPEVIRRKEQREQEAQALADFQQRSLAGDTGFPKQPLRPPSLGRLLREEQR